MTNNQLKIKYPMADGDGINKDLEDTLETALMIHGYVLTSRGTNRIDRVRDLQFEPVHTTKRPAESRLDDMITFTRTRGD